VPLAVHVLDVAVGPGGPDNLWHGVGKLVEPPLTFRYRLLRPLLLLDVGVRSEPVQDLASLVP
jgi:hypothetical protein